jgi:antirestriction protein ArdC
MNEQRELADRVLKAIHEAVIPWRYPNNVSPEFRPTFGKFFTGEPLTEAQVDYAELDSVIASTGAKMTHHWRCKKPRCDRPPLDRILLPPKSRFIDDRQYHAVRIHECLHFLEHPWRASWSGAADQGELIAECGTGFLESFLRLPHDTDNTNIAKWLPKWAEGIAANPAYLFDAVAQAERSVNHLLDLRRRWAAA